MNEHMKLVAVPTASSHVEGCDPSSIQLFHDMVGMPLALCRVELSTLRPAPLYLHRSYSGHYSAYREKKTGSQSEWKDSNFRQLASKASGLTAAPHSDNHCFKRYQTISDPSLIRLSRIPLLCISCKAMTTEPILHSENTSLRYSIPNQLSSLLIIYL